MNQELLHGAKGLKYSLDTVAVAGLPVYLLSHITLNNLYVAASLIWVLLRIWEMRLVRGWRHRISNYIMFRFGK